MRPIVSIVFVLFCTPATALPVSFDRVAETRWDEGTVTATTLMDQFTADLSFEAIVRKAADFGAAVFSDTSLDALTEDAPAIDTNRGTGFDSFLD